MEEEKIKFTPLEVVDKLEFDDTEFTDELGGKEENEPLNEKPHKQKNAVKAVYTNSPLVTYTKLSPCKNSPRNHAIDTITIHCMAGNLTVESCGALFSKYSRETSSNYGIGSDGRIALYVNESDRSWCTSNRANDHRAITIEVANDGGANTGWHVSDKAMASLINLVTDICQRNNIPELRWKADKNLIGQVDKQNMTAHRWFAEKACPGNYLYNSFGSIAEQVNKRLRGETTKPATEKNVEPFKPFLVSISIANLNIRKGPGSNFERTGKYTGKGIFTIEEVIDGKGSKTGWGKLKSGAGWICMDYAKKI